MNPLQIIYGVVALAVVTAVGAYVWDCEREKEQFAVYKAEVKVLGEEADRKAQETTAADLRKKERTDAETKTAIAGFRATIKRLRDADANSRFVSAAPAGSPSPQVACYGRERLNQEISGFTGQVTDILAELGAAAVEFNGAKEWARSSP